LSAGGVLPDSFYWKRGSSMPLVVGIRFRPATKIYYFDPAAVLELRFGEAVIVETTRARELGKVVLPCKEVPQEEIVGQLKPVLRRATEQDIKSSQHWANEERAALQKCQQKAAESQLPIKMIQAEYNFDGTYLVFFFTSEQRVDFRTLVRDLARVFHTRIELRQVGIRDEAKLIGGVGACGRPLCCSSHLCEFIPVSIKMAKQQGLPLSPMEISGVCGRLLCCLTYENAYYQQMLESMPKVGRTVATPEGEGRVTGNNVLKETVHVALESGTMIEVPLADIGKHGGSAATQDPPASLGADEEPE
jgi:cell fate regulator YaaT (PSP1 superfamily)